MALEARGAHFKSLRDPIDTASPQGKFTLQVLGAAAELERALIRERTIAGLGAARAAGRVGGNPGLRRRDREAIRKVVQARDETYFRQLEASADDWLPLVRRHRPGMPWEDLVRIVNAQRQAGLDTPYPRPTLRSDMGVERFVEIAPPVSDQT